MTRQSLTSAAAASLCSAAVATAILASHSPCAAFDMTFCQRTSVTRCTDVISHLLDTVFVTGHRVPIIWYCSAFQIKHVGEVAGTQGGCALEGC